MNDGSWGKIMRESSILKFLSNFISHSGYFLLQIIICTPKNTHWTKMSLCCPFARHGSNAVLNDVPLDVPPETPPETRQNERHSKTASVSHIEVEDTSSTAASPPTSSSAPEIENDSSSSKEIAEDTPPKFIIARLWSMLIDAGTFWLKHIFQLLINSFIVFSILCGIEICN